MEMQVKPYVMSCSYIYHQHKNKSSRIFTKVYILSCSFITTVLTRYVNVFHKPFPINLSLYLSTYTLMHRYKHVYYVFFKYYVPDLLLCLSHQRLIICSCQSSLPSSCQLVTYHANSSKSY